MHCTRTLHLRITPGNVQMWAVSSIAEDGDGQSCWKTCLWAEWVKIYLVRRDLCDPVNVANDQSDPFDPTNR